LVQETDAKYSYSKMVIGGSLKNEIRAKKTKMAYFFNKLTRTINEFDVYMEGYS
jgi:hypothetical protein